MKVNLDLRGPDGAAVLRELEAEDERQRETLRRFYLREKPGMFISWRKAGWFFLKVVAGFVAVFLFSWLWLGF